MKNPTTPDPASTHRTQLEREAVECFREQFKAPPHLVSTAPGRVNLIGEHTDYNDGLVLPAAITRWIAVAAGDRSDDLLVIHASNLQSEVKVPLDKLQPSRQHPWSNYIKGVASLLRNRSSRLQGANLSIRGNIPIAAGLSSSAAMEMTAAYAFLSMNDIRLDDMEVIKLCRQAEQEFAGVQCGIMDQFIACKGKKEHALFLDCRSLEYETVPFPESIQIIICDTGVKRELAASAYNRRRQECEIGVQRLSFGDPRIRSLRDVSVEEFKRNEHLLEETIRKRCRHVVMEIDRVRQSIDAMKGNDLSFLGKLLYESHMSLRNDYEVSCPELDAVVDICSEQEGVYGARMTGAGFGGAAIALVHEGSVNELTARLNSEYPQRTGKQPSIIVTRPDDGVEVRTIAEGR